MTFDPKYFFAEFRHFLNLSRGRDLVAKTYNADDTLRILKLWMRRARRSLSIFL